MKPQPLIVGLGGTSRPGSSTAQALGIALGSAEALGSRIEFFDGAELAGLPLYAPGTTERCATATRLVDSVRQADGVLIASPGYHGSISGLVKNALDYLEDLRQDERPYLSGRGVGCIATGAGWQATVSTLAALRSVTHALRGWPTPMGACVNTAEPGALEEPAGNVIFQLETVAAEVVDFAMLRLATR
jgi:FMN reductase